MGCTEGSQTCAFCWAASPQLFAKFRQNSSLSLRIAWLLPWLMNLMRPGLWRAAWPDITPRSLLSPSWLWRSMLHCARGFYTNCSWQNYWAREQIWIVSCDRLRQTSLEYSQPGEIRNGEQWETKHTCVILSYFEVFGLLFDQNNQNIYDEKIPLKYRDSLARGRIYPSYWMFQ